MTLRGQPIDLKILLAGLIFLGAACVKGGWMLSSLAWTETPAVVEHCDIVEQKFSSGSTFVLKVSYRWEHEGRTYHGDRFCFDNPPVEDSKSKVAPQAAHWPVDATVPCWINPHDPASAVLNRTKGIDFVLAFLIIGTVLLVWALVWPFWVAKGKGRPAGGKRPFPRRALGWALGFVVILVTVMGLMLAEWSARQEVMKWQKTPCTITESRVVYSQREFQPHIRYAWGIDGHSFDSVKVSPAIFSGSVFDAEKTVSDHPAGTASFCWVNPAYPAEAVLEQAPPLHGIFWWFMGLLLSGLCLYQAVSIYQGSRQPRGRVSMVSTDPRGARRFGIRTSALLMTAGVLGLALLWPVAHREWHYGVWMTISQWLLLLAFMALVYGAALARLGVDRFHRE